MKISRLKINRGEDKKIILFFKNTDSYRPVNLEEATNVQFTFDLANRTTVTLDMHPIPPKKASASLFNVGGKFLAVVAGSMGNIIMLNFDGVRNIDQVVNEWNTNNPTNAVEYSGMVGSFVPNAGMVRLADGLNSYTPVEILNRHTGEVRLTLEDNITNSLKVGDNQSFRAIIDFGLPPQGTRRKILINNILDVA